MLGITLTNEFAVTQHVQELTISLRRPCTLQVFCGRTAWVAMHCRRFIGRSSTRPCNLPDCSTQQVHGSYSRRHLTVNESTYCLTVRNVTVIVCQTYWHLKNCARLLTTNCLIKPYPIPIMFCTPSCHRHPWSIAALQPHASYTHAFTSRTRHSVVWLQLHNSHDVQTLLLTLLLTF